MELDGEAFREGSEAVECAGAHRRRLGGGEREGRGARDGTGDRRRGTAMGEDGAAGGRW
jgi:hypothetical protein